MLEGTDDYNLPFADSTGVFYIVGMIVVPIVIAIYTYLSSYREGVSASKRIGAELRGNSPLTVSCVCPECSSSKYEKAPDTKDQFLINYDRKCCDCGALYAYPVPVWLSASLIVLGASLIVAGIALSEFGQRALENTPQNRMGSLAALIVGISLGVWSIMTGYAKLRLAKKSMNNGEVSRG